MSTPNKLFQFKVVPFNVGVGPWSIVFRSVFSIIFIFWVRGNYPQIIPKKIMRENIRVSEDFFYPISQKLVALIECVKQANSIY